jgi:hypothetical protein
MALLYQADIRPSKLELLAAWLPGRPWYQGPPEPVLERVAACRFDDPAGEVGIETILVRAGDGPVLHAPLTYRGAPLEGGEGSLVGTTEHSVLGKRWVYDACGDPVYAAAVTGTVLGLVHQAEEFLEVDGVPVRRDPIMTVSGAGIVDEFIDPPSVTAVRAVTDEDPTIVVTNSVRLAVVRVVGTTAAGATLRGEWAGQAPTPLAYLQSAEPPAA